MDFVINKGEAEAHRHFTVKAKKDVELLVISKGDLYQIGLEFKKEIIELFEEAEERYENLSELRKMCKEWYT